MNFWKKLKETFLCLVPIVMIVIVVYAYIFQFEADLVIKFIASTILIAVGEVLFLTGIDNSIMPMGEFVGNSSGTLKHIFTLIFFAFIFGLFATIAEPDVQVLASEAVILGIPISQTGFIFVIGAGVGLFVALALFRILKSISFKTLVFIILIMCFAVAAFLPDSLLAVAFDAGGATTGIVTSPFLLAISAGISRNKSTKSHSDNFGVNGLASLGPVLAMLVLSLFAGNSSNAVAQANQIHILLDTLLSSLLAIIPLVAVFFIFDLCFIKLPKQKKRALIFGAFVTFVGLYLFLFGINFGFLPTGEKVGSILASESKVLFLIICLILGFFICYTEPAVRVLSAQVEDITQGNISKNGVMIAIAISMMMAIFVSGLKIIFDIPTFYILIAGYALALVLMLFSPNTFAAIAFDSGGVASGPMTSAFVLPLMIGFASGFGDAGSGFGVIAIVSMMPIIIINALGVVYHVKIKAHEKRSYKLALRIAYGADAYSNMDALVEEHERLMMEKERALEMQNEQEVDNENSGLPRTLD